MVYYLEINGVDRASRFNYKNLHLIIFVELKGDMIRENLRFEEKKKEIVDEVKLWEKKKKRIYFFYNIKIYLYRFFFSSFFRIYDIILI